MSCLCTGYKIPWPWWWRMTTETTTRPTTTTMWRRPRLQPRTLRPRPRPRWNRKSGADSGAATGATKGSCTRTTRCGPPRWCRWRRWKSAGRAYTSSRGAGMRWKWSAGCACPATAQATATGNPTGPAITITARADSSRTSTTVTRPTRTPPCHRPRRWTTKTATTWPPESPPTVPDHPRVWPPAFCSSWSCSRQSLFSPSADSEYLLPGPPLRVRPSFRHTPQSPDHTCPLPSRQTFPPLPSSAYYPVARCRFLTVLSVSRWINETTYYIIYFMYKLYYDMKHFKGHKSLVLIHKKMTGF